MRNELREIKGAYFIVRVDAEGRVVSAKRLV